jgi:hypothetical protein
VTRAALANIAIKLLLVALLLFSLVSDLERFSGKAMSARAATYPLAALVVPVWWRLRGRPPQYPHLVDMLIFLPFAIDTGGNVLDLYSVWWFDDLAHFLNWAILVAAFALALSRTRLGRWNTWGLAIGFGAVTEILWELGEYAVMKLGSSGGCGTLLGATLVAVARVGWPAWRASIT